MSKICPGDHKHILLEGSTRCKRAQVYPRQMCKTVCEGIAAQKRADAINLVALDVMSIAELMSVDDDLHDDPCSDMQYIATDDVSGDPLKPNMVIAARNEELDYINSMHVYDYAPLTECIARTNHSLLGLVGLILIRGKLKPRCLDLDLLPRNIRSMHGQTGLRRHRRSNVCDC